MLEPNQLSFCISDSYRLQRLVKQAGRREVCALEQSASLDFRPGIFDREFTALARVLSTVELAVSLTGSLYRPYANLGNEL